MNVPPMHLLKTVGLFGLALSSALSSASAEDDWKTDLTGLYVGGGVGLTKGIETTASGTSGGKVDFNNGAALTVFVGKQLSGNLRGEAELTGRRMDLSSMAGSSANGSAKTTGQHQCIKIIGTKFPEGFDITPRNTRRFDQHRPGFIHLVASDVVYYVVLGNIRGKTLVFSTLAMQCQ